MSARTARKELAALLGMPAAPPGRVTRAANAARRGLARAHRSSAPPPIHVLEALLGVFDNRVLGLLVDLDIPERLDVPRTVTELAGDRYDPEQLDRVLRYGAGRGFIASDRSGRYSANAVTSVLRSDHPNSWRGWVEFASSDWFWDACRRADAAIAVDGCSGVEAATGHEFFEFVSSVRPAAGRAFNDAMRAGATLQALGLAAVLDWSSVTSVCDVGGGTGAAAATLREHHEHLSATVFDLPEVTETVGGGLSAVGGDFFEEIPAGFDRYLLMAIVHDWDDESAVRILANVASALPPSSDAMVVEAPLSDRPRDSFEAASDLLMLCMASGRERRLDEYQALFDRAGLRLADTTVLPTGFTAFRLVSPRVD